MWDLLPDEIILLIFKYLQDYDLINASSSCKKWNRVYKEPCLWRSRTFELRGYCRSQAERIEMLTKYVKSMGEYLQDIRILCPSPNLLTAHSVAASVDTLLSGLSSLNEGSRTIRVFHLKDLHFHESWGSFRSSMCYLVECISTFLQNQTNLRCVDMTNAYMSPPYGYRIIKAFMKSKSTKTVEVLRLINYYYFELSTHNIGHQLRTLSNKCSNLREVSLNYSYLLSVTLVDLCEIMSDSLEKLVLFATVLDFCDNNLEVIRSEQWSAAQAICPKLQVHFDIAGWPENPATILVPRIPLVHISVKGGQSPRSIMSVGGKASLLLDYLAQYFNKVLQSVCFIAEGHRIFSLSNDSLISFLNKCKKLDSLVFSGSLVTVDYITKVKDELGKERLIISDVNQSRVESHSFI
ncbi:hypothetical protein Btru_024753 [Bulinus truncatus]|nr:hypothetical protein Btru_024753 [Bulinus truncatus]